jgi:hypothetical protein
VPGPGGRCSAIPAFWGKERPLRNWGTRVSDSEADAIVSTGIRYGPLSDLPPATSGVAICRW